MTTKTGFMIVVDGGNGAGKTTIIKAIEGHLQSLGREIIFTREPGGTPIGEKIREVVLSPDTPEMCDTTELMLFAAARAQHVVEKIVPAVQLGKIVISDRFAAATVSFQHFARGMSLDLINQLNDMALNGFQPDINIVLDLDPVIGLERVRARGDSGADRMENQNLEFLQKARHGYLEQARLDPEHFVVIDASQPMEKVISDVLAVVSGIISVE